MATNRNNQQNSYSLAHTKWNCKYRKFFVLKFRRREFKWTETGVNRKNSEGFMHVERVWGH